MSAHKNIDRICIIIVAFTLAIAVIFCTGGAFITQPSGHVIGYENRLFDHSKVHTIDIVMNDWDGFVENCESEEYSACNLVIDGEAVKNVGIRGKGNTSLSSVKNMNSSRYSFKIEFDQYENGKTYHGLDKLCLNNIIQDNTYMKDYLAYTLMNDFDVDAPLCSYTYITVNGEDWGLYLAVEAVEESFLERNYGSNFGELYKPDSMSFGGGGPGNGKDFSMSDFMNKEDGENSENEKNNSAPDFGGSMPDFGNGGMPQFDPENMPADFDSEDFDPSKTFGEGGGMPDFGGGKSGFGMGSDDVKLKYTDDNIDSYSNIFDNAKTPVDKADKKRLISSLKALYEQSDIENTLDTDEVLRYFVVHNFLVNGDSYTGQMIHNYYLYEENGQLSMIPWDYNLAFGTFMGGNASSSVNSAIDTPVSGDMSDRPMVSWIFDNEEYIKQYHQLFSEFIGSVDIEKLVSDTAALIDKYVEKDPTKFCTYDEFKKGVEAISKFCELRTESVSGQLNGSIPSTSDGQKSDSSSLVDTNGLNISDMGTMNNKGGPNDEQKGSFGRTEKSEMTEKADRTVSKTKSNTSALSVKTSNEIHSVNNVENFDFNGEPPQGFNGEAPDFSGQPPQDFDGEMPEGFDPNKIPDGFTPENKPETGDENKEIGEEATNNETNISSSDSEQNENTFRPSSESRENERPQMGDFPPMNGNEQSNNATAYIMLGVSALVLLLGLGYALKFKR